MLPKIIAISTVVSFFVLSALLVFTTPATAGPFGLLFVFISAYLVCLGVISLFLWSGNRALRRALKGVTVRKPLQPLPYRRAYYFSTMLAMAPVMLVGLQSVGAVGLYEIGLIAVFEVIACMYISRKTA